MALEGQPEMGEVYSDGGDGGWGKVMMVEGGGSDGLGGYEKVRQLGRDVG